MLDYIQERRLFMFLISKKGLGKVLFFFGNKSPKKSGKLTLKPWYLQWSWSHQENTPPQIIGLILMSHYSSQHILVLVASSILQGNKHFLRENSVLNFEKKKARAPQLLLLRLHSTHIYIVFWLSYNPIIKIPLVLSSYIATYFKAFFL